eukprot:3956540-Prymnesium_polylepis.1
MGAPSGARRSRKVYCSRLSRQRNGTRTTSHVKLARCRGAMSCSGVSFWPRDPPSRASRSITSRRCASR